MNYYISFFTFLLLLSCNTTEPIEHLVHDKVHDVDFIYQHHSGPALSASEDRIFVHTAKGRELIFEGYGATRITAKSLRKGVVIVEYCGGSIRRTASFLSNVDPSGNVLAVKIQPIIVYNVSIDGKKVCAEQGLG